MRRKIKGYFFIYILLLIILLGFFMRFYNLSSVPSGFFCDEASIGYNAYTLLKNGTDEAGNKFPILFQNFGNFYRPPISIYISSIFVYFLGLNEFSVRLSASVFGTLTIITIFYLSKNLFSSNRVAILSSFFLAIAPWHIHFSRIGQEFIYFTFFLTLSLTIFLTALNRSKSLLFIVSFLFFAITIYTYVPSYFVTPLFIISIVLIYWKSIKTMRKELILGFLIFFILLIPLFLGLRDGKTLSRFYQVSSLNETKTKKEVIFAAIRTYKDHFMPQFLFQKGDIGYQTHFITRFSVKGIGQLYWFQLPLILFGFLQAMRFKKSLIVILILLALYPLGSTLAPLTDGGGPFAMRSIIGVVPFQILSALGFTSILSIFKKPLLKRSVLIFLILIIILSFSNYLRLYFVEYPLYSSDFWGWQYGPKEVIKYFLSVRNSYDDLYLSSEFNAPEIFLKFYDPKNICQNKCKIGHLQQDELIYNSNRRQLFALSPISLANSKYKDRFMIKKMIYYPNGKVAFQIGEVIK